MLNLLLALCLVTTLQMVSGASIILVPPQIDSHVLDHVTVGESLSARGHQVFLVLASPYPDVARIESRGIKTLQYKIPQSDLYGVSEEFQKFVTKLIFGDEDSLIASFREVSRISYRDCACMMNDNEFLDAVRKVSPDLAVVDAFLPAPCTSILPKFLGIPFVSTSLLFMPWEHRFPALPSFAPLMLIWTNPSDITFLSRLQNLLNYVRGQSLITSMAPTNNSLLEKFAPEMKSWNELLHHSELFFLLVDHHFGNTFPQVPNYISMAGISTSKARALPSDLEEIMRNAEDGVIILTFGTIGFYFPVDVVTRFLDAFGRLNQTVLARIHIPNGVAVPGNVVPFSWLPQNDLLGHPKTKLFITHCGNGGLHEALYHGTPIVGFPLFADQRFNCQRSYKYGFGLCMNIKDFTSDQLFDNILEVLINPRYRSTIQKASAIFKDQPVHPLNRTVFWIEHVINFGGKHLRPFSMDMPLYQFLMLDVIGLLLVAVMSVIIALLSLMRYIKCRCMAMSENKSKLKSN